jgi:aminopeptidase YwaD
MTMRLAITAALLCATSTALAQPAAHAPLLPPAQSEAIAAELSGGAMLRTVRTLSSHHRMRGSTGYRAAAEAIRDRLRDAGLSDVEIIALPADGRIFYGTQRSRPGWNADFAELWERRGEGAAAADSVRIASWGNQPISLAQDSASGRADAALVDVGAGTSEADYAGKDVRGRLILTSSQPSAVQALAIGRFGAAGIVSWAQNQRTAWWGEDESLVRWGHLETFSDHPAFAFMVSPRQAHVWQARLRAGETVRLRAEVRAGRTPSAYLIPTAVIPGRDRTHEIVYSCHLDHPSPGANDNASGCAGILEIARTLQRLVASGALPQPARTIRFIWPCEIECTIALLNARPIFARRTLATLHLDMIGGNTAVTGSILRVHGSPPSLPSFVSDVGFAFARWVNDQSLQYASTGAAAMPLVDPDGGRHALQAEISGFDEGSDHQVWAEGSWRIPVIYIADWPDRYIHTQRDVPDNLDPTKMRRAGFIAAASGWYLAGYGRDDPAMLGVIQQGAMLRNAAALERVRLAAAAGGTAAEVENIERNQAEQILASLASASTFGSNEAIRFPALRGPSGPVYRRILNQGPMDGFGYSWFDDRLARAGLPRPALLARAADYGGPSFGYEALNLVDGRRGVGEIRDALAATVGLAPVEEVAAYLDTLARLGVLEPRP